MRGDPPQYIAPHFFDAWSTPHARGSTFQKLMDLATEPVYPACAGIHLLLLPYFLYITCLPRMRGDPPYGDLHNSTRCKSTPHARGSTPPAPQPALRQTVYPACAGIHPVLVFGFFTVRCLPRMRGDPPMINSYTKIALTSTPHARGSTQHQSLLTTPEVVYPACAGIHPVLYLSIALVACLPRMRGDPPKVSPDKVDRLVSTPHARGSTWVPWFMGPLENVYPACAGIHPGDMLAMLTFGCLPRMRGDPPLDRLREDILALSTPHARGSTATLSGKGGRKMVYPACAGIHR